MMTTKMTEDQLNTKLEAADGTDITFQELVKESTCYVLFVRHLG
jgi:hypothetical protein